MKRFRILLLCVFFASFAVLASACNNNVAGFEFDTPWIDDIADVFTEKSTFHISHEVLRNGQLVEVATGTLTYELGKTTGEELGRADTAGRNRIYYFLETNLMIEFNETAGGDLTGKVDRMSSRTVFGADGNTIMLPQKVTKTINYQTNLAANMNVSYTYGDGIKLTHDRNGGNELTFTRRQVPRTVFDNEQLLLLARSPASHAFNLGAQFGYTIFSAADTIFNNTLSTFDILIQIGDAIVNLDIETDLTGLESDTHTVQSGDRRVVPCFPVRIFRPTGGIGNFTTGPEILAWFSERPTRGAQRRILVKYQQEHRNLAGDTTNRTTYTLRKIER
jgi:hypothetical protein